MSVLASNVDQMTRGLEQRRRAEILVAVDGSSDTGEAMRAAVRIGRQLGAAYPSRQAIVLLLSESPGEPAPVDVPLAESKVPLVSWCHPGQSAIEALLRAGASFEAAACAIVAPTPEDAAPSSAASRLVAPVLEDGIDLVAPTYATHRFDGVVNTGIVYPLTRALFGKRLRQPFGTELAISRRAGEHLLGDAWLADPAHAGERVWLVTALLAGAFQVCQAQLGAPPPRLAETGADLAGSLAHVMGLLFHEMRVHAATWQRVKGSRPVKTCGEDLSAARGDARQPQIGPLISAFQLGYQELGGLWSSLLPPQTLLSLKRLTKEPEEAFGIDDSLWARIVYDFAVGYRLGTMERMALLRSMTPIYLGWAAGFVREVRDLDQAAVEGRVERLCRAFELAKPYLISRWRWPDRFNP